MIVYYADTSALLRAYVRSEPDHHDLRQLLREGDHLVLTSELSRVEFASAAQRAARGRRVRNPGRLVASFDGDCGRDGSIRLLRFGARRLLHSAHRLVNDHPLRTLDALQLATALLDARAVAGDDPVVFVTRDEEQATAARAEGLEVT